MALTTTAEVLQALKILSPLPEIQARYNLLRQQVEAAIKTYCKWGLEAVTGQVDYYDGNGYVDITLNNPYVSAITSVYQDPTGFYGQGLNPFPASTLLTAGVDYALAYDNGSVARGGRLRRLLNNFLLMFPSDLMYYRMAGGLSYQRGPFWPAGQGNIKVTYNYGFSTIPDDIKLAVETAVGTIANSVKYGFPLSSESLGAHSYSTAISREPEFGTVRQLLSRYRDVAI